MSVVAMRHRAVVGGQRVFITEHAIERYIERVRPTLTRSLAIAELGRVLRHATVHDRPPEFCREIPVEGDARPTRWVVLADSIAFPVERDRLLTCVVQGGLSDASRASKAAARRARKKPQKNPGERVSGGSTRSGMRRLQEFERRHGRDAA